MLLKQEEEGLDILVAEGGGEGHPLGFHLRSLFG